MQTYFPYDQEENDKRYKEIQKQRELERNVRAAKRECAMLKNGDPEEFKKASVRLKERTAQLKQYCSEHDLTYMNERTSVLGYGHSEASKVTAAYRKALKEEEEKLKQIELDNNRAILKSKIESGEFPLELRSGKQSQHIKGDGYIQGKSYLNLTMEEIQDIVNRYHATGNVIIKNNGTQFKETIVLEQDVGVDIPKGEIEGTPTNRITIHYSVKGTHVVPTRRKS